MQYAQCARASRCSEHVPRETLGSAGLNVRKSADSVGRYSGHVHGSTSVPYMIMLGVLHLFPTLDRPTVSGVGVYYTMDV